MGDWLDSIEARTKAQAKYDKGNTVGFYMKLNIHTDQDIIRWLWGQPSKQGSHKKAYSGRDCPKGYSKRTSR